MHRPLAVALVATVALSACGSEADARDPGRFCERVRLLQPALTDPSDPVALIGLYEDLSDETPLQIEDDWNEITLLLGEVTSYDPANKEEVQAVVAASLRAQAAINTVGAWVRDNCKVDLGPIPTTVPIGGTGDALLTDASDDLTSDDLTSDDLTSDGLTPDSTP